VISKLFAEVSHNYHEYSNPEKSVILRKDRVGYFSYPSHVFDAGWLKHLVILGILVHPDHFSSFTYGKIKGLVNIL